MAYFESSIVTPTLAECGPAEALIETIRASRALNVLMYHFNMSDIDHQRGEDFAEGISQLLETQSLILAGIQNAMEAEADARAADDAAKAQTVTPENVAQTVRRDFIIAQAEAGVDPMVIAQGLGMKIANVALVIASAVAEGAPK